MPFPFMAVASDALRDPSGHHVLLFQVHPAQKPTCMDDASRPPQFHTIFSTKTNVFRHTLTPFPVAGSVEVVESRAFTEHYAPASPPPLEEAALLDRLHTASLDVPYLKDIEAADLWTPLTEEQKQEQKQKQEQEQKQEQKTSAPDHGKKQKQQKRKQKTSASSHGKKQKQQKQEQETITAPPDHFLNTTCFTDHAQSLLSLVATVGYSDFKGKTCEGSDFAGFSSAFTYCKGPNSFFHMHTEQLFAPFYNYCWEGSTIWYYVRDCDRGLLDAYLIKRTRRHYQLDDGGAPMTEAQQQLLLALLYAKKLFFDPRDMVREGVPVQRVHQQANQVLLGHGSVVRWGVCGGAYSINEAINYVPVTWLAFGLPQLLEYTEWFLAYVQQHGQPMHQGLRDVVYNAEVRRLVSNHTPLMWTRMFLGELVADLRRKRSRIDYSAVDGAVLAQSVASCQRILAILDDASVVSFCRAAQ